MIRIAFAAGTLTIAGTSRDELPAEAAACCRSDPRTEELRARACDYAKIALALRAAGIPYVDEARRFGALESLHLVHPLVPRPHQARALAAWKAAGFRGVVSLPTGSGKTILAVMAMEYLKRPTLVLAPTIDLISQWAETLERFFGVEVGLLGGGSHEIRDLTVSTYDSAVLNMEFIGDRFAFLVADECHHLPAAESRLAAAMSIAPYRLGLSATPELPDDRAAVMRDLLGDTVIEVTIDELEGKTLSPYAVRSCRIPLDPAEEELYRRHRAVYTGFLKRHRISFADPSGWGRFLGLAARLPEGREVFHSFLEQRRLARGGEAKLRKLWELVLRHAGERILVFTADNATAYEIGRRFLWPVLTHHTGAAERKEFLAGFRQGSYPVLVTSKVLNEGVDVPAAAVGIVLSGSGSVREHVQRLGRILRPAPGKAQAVLYEIISSGTSEESVSTRRRGHRAYRRKTPC